MIDQLIDVISREAEVFESFLELLDQQRDKLIANDVIGLNRTTQFQQEKISESRRLSEERESLVAEIKKQKGLDSDATLSKLLSVVDQHHADQLSQLSQLILGLNDQINESRNKNVMLLNSSRQQISRMIQMLSELNSPRGTYSRSGANTKGRTNLAMDRRV